MILQSEIFESLFAREVDACCAFWFSSETGNHLLRVPQKTKLDKYFINSAHNYIK